VRTLYFRNERAEQLWEQVLTVVRM